MSNPDLYQKGLHLLRSSVGNPAATFREGQWESIEAILKRQKILVVQRTGWGKSLVYFIATRLLRDSGAGPTLLISPLLSLMRNQIKAAELIGINAATINSNNKDDWTLIESDFSDGRVDVLLISPERLANESFRKNVLLASVDDIGLFVVDEAHCISDWGHDFRPDYRRIVSVLKLLPDNIPILATTATANNRVVQDVSTLLGSLRTIRGPLTRNSLKLQNIRLPSPASRMAWLAEVLPTIKGSGVIYTLTVRDAERVAEWLQLQGINALAYHSRIEEDREDLEEKLLNNEIKALVATVALGMGFDKPDLTFVIHFQRPGSVVHYYQQVGRAGRAVESAYGILLSGEEDKEITDYFIHNAFPPQAHVEEVLDALELAEDGMSIQMLEHEINLTRREIEKVLTLLSVEEISPVIKQGVRWYRTATKYEMDVKQISELTAQRESEQSQLMDYTESTSCLMQYLSNALDDPFASVCGNCSPCQNRPLLPVHVNEDLTNAAAKFLKRSHLPIEPRKKWVYQFKNHAWNGKINNDLRAEVGRALSLWGDAGWGESVRQGKYHDGSFNDTLVEGCVEMVQLWKPVPFPEWLTCVPSLKHPNLVPDFTRRLAEKLNLPFVDCIIKLRENLPQKQMQNSYQQARNLDGVFAVKGQVPNGAVFLLDDMIDSRWTMTVISALLRENGSGLVYPLGLALNSFS